ncbi:MAG: DUF4445 domain-containing protein [Phycisphaerae bacterium]|nr:DUF4445 domain-containing protein [Phycisphaerae bacterium]
MATVIFNGEHLDAAIGESLFTVADRAAQGTEEIGSSCQRTGSCKECIVQIKHGNEALTPCSKEEAFLQPQADSESAVFRLACQARIMTSDAVIVVETFKRRLEIAVSGREAPHGHDPWIERSGDAVTCDGERLAHHTGPIYGVAIDVGTTTVVLHAVDLETAETVAIRAFENPQKYGGSDVLHRISYDKLHPGQLHGSILAHVNATLRGLPINRRGIFAVTVAGNPTMRDLFFGFDVQPIGQSPYISVTQAEFLAGQRGSTAVRAEGRSLGLAVHPKACVYGLPLVSHHVGADIAAVLATIPIESATEPFLVIDVGTNSEVAVGHRGRIICTSCPAGPAFEGGRLTCGMAASDGAITALKRDGGTWNISAIGSGPPRGLCGSGLVDLLAELVANDEMDRLGRFRNGDKSVAVCERSSLHFTQADASELAQAKAANALGQMMLLRTFGIRASQIGTYYLAGAFANNMNVANAQQIGLLLSVAEDRIARIGNASIEGAKAALLSRSCRDRIEAMVRTIEHVELEKEPDFFDRYVEALRFAPIEAG